MSKTTNSSANDERDTYKKEREPRTYRRKVEEVRIREVKIPHRNQLDASEFLDEGDTTNAD